MTATADSYTLGRVSPSDVLETLDVRNACADDLTRRFGFGAWSARGHLPTARMQARDKYVLAARLDGRCIATMTLSTQRPRVHRREWFAQPAAIACYLTGLYVLPDVQGRGVGTWMMRHADAIAKQWRCPGLRFDAYVGPAGAAPFYHKLGYESRGEHEVAGVMLEVFERCF